MKSETKTLLIVGIIIAVIIFSKSDILFRITGQERMERQVNDVYVRNTPRTFDVNYEASNIEENWGATIVDTISGGCKWAGGETTLKIVVTNQYTTEVEARIANDEIDSCTFSGDYQFGTEQVRDFTDKTINIHYWTQVESNPTGAKVYKNDVYVGSTTPWGSYVINAGDKLKLTKEGYLDKTYTITTSDVDGLNTITLDLEQNQCQSGADTDNNGEVILSEVTSYGNKWINNQITRTKMGQAIQEWANGC